MKAEKYCGLCGQKIEIEYEPRQPVKVICPNCNAETDWKFYKNGNFDTVTYLKDEAVELHERMKKASNDLQCNLSVLRADK